MWKTAFKNFEAIWVYLNRPYHFKFFKDCLAQILLSPFLNTLSHINIMKIFPPEKLLPSIIQNYCLWFSLTTLKNAIISKFLLAVYPEQQLHLLFVEWTTNTVTFIHPDKNFSLVFQWIIAILSPLLGYWKKHL